jgi:hypothetical protein
LYNGVDRTGDISNPRELVIGDSSRRDNALPAELADIRIYRSALNEPQAAAAARLRRHAAANPAEMSVSNHDAVLHRPGGLAAPAAEADALAPFGLVW